MDGAKEFTEGQMGDYLHSRGITLQITAPCAHSQAGKAEPYIRTIEDGLQMLLADSKLPFYINQTKLHGLPPWNEKLTVSNNVKHSNVLLFQKDEKLLV